MPTKKTTTKNRIQRKPAGNSSRMAISSPQDAHEKEASRAADRVLSTDMNRGRVAGPSQGNMIHRHAAPHASGGFASEAVTSAIQKSRGGGSPMSDSVRSRSESQFGFDFKNIRIHSDQEAGRLSRSLNADAFTVGTDIYFDSNKYQPNSRDGQKLLSHELAHTVQNSGGIQRSAKDGLANITPGAPVIHRQVKPDCVDKPNQARLVDGSGAARGRTVNFNLSAPASYSISRVCDLVAAIRELQNQVNDRMRNSTGFVTSMWEAMDTHLGSANNLRNLLFDHRQDTGPITNREMGMFLRDVRMARRIDASHQKCERQLAKFEGPTRKVANQLRTAWLHTNLVWASVDQQKEAKAAIQRISNVSDEFWLKFIISSAAMAGGIAAATVLTGGTALVVGAVSGGMIVLADMALGESAGRGLKGKDTFKALPTAIDVTEHGVSHFAGHGSNLVKGIKLTGSLFEGIGVGLTVSALAKERASINRKLTSNKDRLRAINAALPAQLALANAEVLKYQTMANELAGQFRALGKRPCFNGATVNQLSNLLLTGEKG